MTSSKSFRATLLPFRSDSRSVSASTTASTASGSTSASTALSTSASTFTSASLSSLGSRSRSRASQGLSLLKSLRHSKSTADLVRQRHQPPSPPPPQTDAAPVGRKKHRFRDDDLEDEHDPNPVDPNHISRRSTTWNIRVSSLIPLLTSQLSDATQLPIHRKAIPVNTIPTPSLPTPPPPPPTEAPPPPPSPPPPPPAAVPQSPESTGTPNDESQDAMMMIQSEPQQVDSSLACPQDDPPEPPISSASPDMPEISVSTHSQPRTTGTKLPPIESDFVSPVFHGLDAKDWTLQTSFLDDHIEGGPLQQSRADFGPRKDSLPDAIKSPAVSVQVSAPVVNVSGLETVSSPVRARSATSTSVGPSPAPASRAKLRRSWMPGGRSRANSFETHPYKHTNGNVSAWVIAEDSRAEYNTSFLRNGDKVPELWNDDGGVLVYLFPKGSGHGPSFKVPEFTVSTSHIFNELISAEMGSPSYGHRSPKRNYGGSLSAEDATRIMSPTTSPSEDYPGLLTLYIPTAPPTEPGQPATYGGDAPADLNRLIAIRNLFAFLTGQPFVGTKTAPNNFRALLGVADLLEEFCFASPDGTTFGTAVDLSFSFYMDQLGLADCRYSREETLEALILAERMRSTTLYNEAFAHGAGKYAAIMELRLPIFEQVSQLTRERLERAHLDLVNRQHNVNETLEQFEFPSLFAGIANSTSIPELKAVRFKIWKASFQKMRQFVLGFYRTQFGSWPPKASNKKSPFAESGLNRLVLKALYSDMCALYDLLADRNNLTSRVIDEVPAISEEADKMTTSALRNILSEFDRSKPPVLPPIPFDLPQIPSMTSVLETYNHLSAKEQAKFDKKIKEHELILVLNKAYNYDINGINIPFLDQFKEFELREAKGKTSSDLIDHRIGYWLFLYSVLQSLPMLVVDAPDLEYTDGTEYFLCEPPMGNPPWIDARQVRKMWYEVSGGGGYVELSADAVNFSPEAVYHRSHCWLAAKRWEEMNESIAPSLEPPTQPPQLSPLRPPQNIFEGVEGFSSAAASLSGNSTPSSPSGSPKVTATLRNQSPGRRRISRANRSSIVMGLEPVPLELPSLSGIHQRSSSLASPLQSNRLGNRNKSAGNLASMNVPQEPAMDSPGSKSISGATFDDILGESQKKRKADKKKSRFF